MFKRITAMILCLLAIVGAIPLTSCSKADNEPITKGEWLNMLCEGFGMSTYTEETPYTTTVDSDDAYFSGVQIAFEWEIIDEKDIDVYEKVTKGYLAKTLVKCVGLTDVADMTDDEITEYAVENNYVAYDFRGRTDSIRYVTKAEASESIEKSFDIWTNRKYEYKEELTVGENVKNLAQTNLSADQIHVDKVNNTVIIPESAAAGLVDGETLVLPPNGNDTTISAYKVEDVVFENGYAKIVTSEATIENTIQDMEISGSIVPDLSTVPITDGLGNVINADAATSMNYYGPDNSGIYNPVDGDGEFIGATPCAKGKIEFEIDGLKISGSTSGNDVEFEISGDIPLKKFDGAKVTVKKSYAIEDISFDYDWDIEWFKLKSAYAKLNYTTKDTTGVGLKYENEGALFADQRGNYAEDENDITWWKNFWKKDLKPKAAAKGAKTITICSFPIVNGGVARVDIDIKAKFSVSGEVEIEVTTRNSNGLEYKKGNFRIIKSKDTDVAVNIKAALELTAYAGVTLKAVGIDIVGVGFEAGIGAEWTTTMHLVNIKNERLDEVSLSISGNLADEAGLAVQGSYYGKEDTTASLHLDVCGDRKVYFILRFKFDEDCAVSDILKGKKSTDGTKFKLEIEIFGKDNALIKKLCKHVENGEVVAECTRTYSEPEEETTEVTTDTAVPDEETTGATNGNAGGNEEFLDIDTYFLNMFVGNSAKIEVTDIPEGYDASSVKFASSDAKIATVDASGNIKAVSEGMVQITASIPGTDYSVTCSVIVNTVGDNGFTGLKETGM